MYAALFPAARALLRFPNSPGEVLGTLKVAINRQTATCDFGTLRMIDIENRLEGLADSFETSEWEALLDALRRSMPVEAWPITFDVRFFGEQCASVCSGLGFAGLRSDQPLFHKGLSREPSDVFLVDLEEVPGIYGLDRIAEAMRWLSMTDIVQANWSHPLCAWSFLEHEAHSNELDWIGVHAKSEAEAMLKIAIDRIGFQATREAFKRYDAAALGAGGDLSLVSLRLTGLEEDPRGRPAPINNAFDQFWVARPK